MRTMPVKKRFSIKAYDPKTYPARIKTREIIFTARLNVQRVKKIVRGKRGITPETAWLFADAFGTSPEFWLNLQTNYDLVRHRPKRRVTRIAVVA
jgi:addiction module HigA family antidote